MTISVNTVWNIRNGGSDNNGGGFVSGASGTNRSLQDAAQVAIDNATITTSITTNTITFTGGYSPSSADVGNIVQMLTGTNVTAGTYEITATGASTWTMDRNVVTSGTTTNATGNMGGAFASPGKALSYQAAGHKYYLKYHATPYDVSTTSANVSNGRLNFTSNNQVFEGYETTQGDLSSNRPTIRATTNTMTLVTLGNSGLMFGNVIVDAGAATGITGVVTATNTITHRVKVVGANATAGFSAVNNSQLLLCEANACTVEGFRMQGASAFGCIAEANTDDGFDCTSNGSMLAFCISHNNSGGGSDGFVNSGASSSMYGVNCLAYGNGQAGFNNPGVTRSVTLVNCIAYNNASGNGIGGSNPIIAVNCASGANSTNYTANVVQTNCVTLTADPFTNAASDDFSLTTSVGGGASCRAAGLLGVFPSLVSSTGYLDIGPVQIEAAAAQTFVMNSINAQFTAARGAVGY